MFRAMQEKVSKVLTSRAVQGLRLCLHFYFSPGLQPLINSEAAPEATQPPVRAFFSTPILAVTRRKHDNDLPRREKMDRHIG